MLSQQDAVIDAHINKRERLRAAYDASRIGMRDIETLLDAIGVARDPSLWSRLKLSWFRMTDENARDNARAGTGACCNRPPIVPHNRGSRK
ncbi:MAG: hypothetical protein HUJ30_06085 [Gammaproteobacteria bacterium]|nr:hypothetical protein [Gammaproteobacteria bacterium]